MLIKAPPHALRIFLFGQPRFEANGAPHKFSAPPKTLPLLAYLLLHRAGPVNREKLAYTLWENESEEDALADLRRHLYYLHKALGPTHDGRPWIVADRDNVQWNAAADYWLDVAEFERLIASPDRRGAAVELYAGDLLESLYDEWLFASRDRLRASYLAALSELVVERRSVRDFAMAAAYAQRILTADPWREDVVRRLMTIRYESGDRAGALHAFDRFATGLREEMNVEPMPETLSLRELILRSQPLVDEALGAGPEVDAGSARVQPVLPFAGRGLELEHLRTTWSRAARGNGTVAFIWGEAGIGKTRLASELALRAEAEGARVIIGGTAEPETVPYQALVEALRSVAPMLASLDVDPMWLAALSVMVPDVRARRPDLPALPAVEPDREQVRLFQSLAVAIEALARPRPLLVVLEDLHWAGSATIDALEFLARRIPQLPVLIVATFREEEAPLGHALREATRRLRRDKLANSSELGSLDRAAVEFIVGNVDGGVLPGESPVEAALYLQETTEGHPLFLTECIRERKEAFVAGDAPKADASQAASMPQSVRALLASRLARLSPDARALADAIAVIGRGFDVDFAHEAVGWSEERMLRQLDELRDRNVIRETAGRNRFDYVFTHHLIQASVYDAILPDERVQWHHRVARLIERSSVFDPQERAAALARHFELGNDPERASASYLAAARQAFEVRAHSESLDLVAHGLRLANDLRVKRELLLLQETVLGLRGDRIRQKHVLDELDALISGSDDSEFLIDVLRRRVWLHRMLGEREAEHTAIEALIEASASSGSSQHRSSGLLERGTYLELIGDYDAATSDFTEAASLYQAAGDVEGEVECYCALARLAAHRERVPEARAMIDRALALGESVGPRVKAKLLESAANEAAVRQDFAAYAAAAQQLLDVCRAAADRRGEATAHQCLAAAACGLLHVKEARAHFEASQRICAELSDIEGQARTLHDSAVLDISVGRNEDARRALVRAEELFSALGHERGAGYSALNLSAVAFQLGDYAEGKAAASRALEFAKKMKNRGLEAGALINLATSEAKSGERGEALVHAEAAVDMFRSSEQPAELGALLAELAVIRALNGDGAGAVKAADECLALWERHGRDMRWPVVVLWYASRVHRATRRHKRSKELLARAYALLRERAAEMPDDETRASFESICYHRDLTAAHERDVWPPLQAAKVEA